MTGQVAADLLRVFFAGLTTCYVALYVVGVFVRPPDWVLQLRAEMLWLFHVGNVYDVGYRFATDDTLFNRTIVIVHAVLWWWWTRNDWDDRWKKRRKKLVGKVKDLGGKLVVQPTGA